MKICKTCPHVSCTKIPKWERKPAASALQIQHGFAADVVKIFALFELFALESALNFIQHLLYLEFKVPRNVAISR
jgi:hypothetical protein